MFYTTSLQPSVRRPSNYCILHGQGDRIRGLLSVFVYALLTHRAFFIDWPLAMAVFRGAEDIPTTISDDVWTSLGVLPDPFDMHKAGAHRGLEQQVAYAATNHCQALSFIKRVDLMSARPEWFENSRYGNVYHDYMIDFYCIIRNVLL